MDRLPLNPPQQPSAGRGSQHRSSDPRAEAERALYDSNEIRTGSTAMTKRLSAITSLIAAVLLPSAASAFNSGSTGADGALNPTVNTELQLPPSGIFNFTSVNVPTGVTLTFKRNATNTPVVILASGDVTVAGTINVSGASSTNGGASGDGNVGDDGQPGLGGPGGLDGGRGGATPNRAGGAGLGPGGGGFGVLVPSNACRGVTNQAFGGGGGGFGSAGGGVSDGCISASPVVSAGATYGSSLLLPLIGGSGGGGGAGGSTFASSGGGGGGGAMLIAASGTVNVTGTIAANGGSSGAGAGAGFGGTGGGGSGGAIRVVATTIAGNGTISAAGGAGGDPSGGNFWQFGSDGGVGRIRLESEIFTRTAATNPAFTRDVPGALFVAGFPTLRITSVAGIAAPAQPTGNADITLPATTPNPVTVEFVTTGVPVGNTVRLTVTPASGATISAVSPALAGTTDNATASVQVSLPAGPSVLSAQTTYTIVASLGDEMSRFAQGERVEKITVSTTMNGPSRITLVTVSGKEFEVDGAALAGLGS